MGKRERETGRRTGERVGLQTSVHFGHPPKRSHSHVSFVTDISPTGLGLTTKKRLEPGKRLYLFVDHFDNVYEARGVVVWTKNASPVLSWLKGNKAGIKLEYADHRLIDLYKLELGMTS